MAHEVSSREISDIMLDLIESTRRMTHLHYALWVGEGFHWDSNVESVAVESVVRTFENRGYDVRVGGQTFIGDEGPYQRDERAVLIKKREAA